MYLSDEILKSICFICAHDKNGNPVPVGTGFFMGIEYATGAEGKRWAGVVVTALHVVSEIEQKLVDKRISLRVSTHDGGFDYVETQPADWVKPDHADGFGDAAVCFFPHNNQDHFDFTFLTDEHAATSEVISSQDISIGSDVYFAGLFINHYGKQRNEPIARSGTLASMPKELISHMELDWRAYLVESRSIGGLSGSPVLVHQSPYMQQGKTLVARKPGSQAWFLLGIMRGHWDERIEIVSADGEPQPIGSSLQLSKIEAVNMGIAIVIPIEAVLPLANECAYRELERRRTAAETATDQIGS
jgi:hypothetical protein